MACAVITTVPEPTRVTRPPSTTATFSLLLRHCTGLTASAGRVEALKRRVSPSSAEISCSAGAGLPRYWMVTWLTWGRIVNCLVILTVLPVRTAVTRIVVGPSTIPAVRTPLSVTVAYSWPLTRNHLAVIFLAPGIATADRVSSSPLMRVSTPWGRIMSPSVKVTVLLP